MDIHSAVSSSASDTDAHSVETSCVCVTQALGHYETMEMMDGEFAEFYRRKIFSPDKSIEE
eukprot:916-Eustigmatos_ZCMA.PRE.1